MNSDNDSLGGAQALTKLRIRRAIAQAQSTCQNQGPTSRACELTWDHALTLQVSQCVQAQQESESRP